MTERVLEDETTLLKVWGFLKKNYKLFLEKLWQAIGFFGVPYAVFSLTNSYLFDPKEYFNWQKYLINYLFFALMLWTLFLLIGRFRVAALIETVFFMIFSDIIIKDYKRIPIDLGFSMINMLCIFVIRLK